LIARAHALQTAGDFEAFVRLAADDMVRHDRRRLVNHPDIVGRDQMLEAQEAARELGRSQVRSRAIATRGDRLALHEIESEYPSGIVPVLGVSETDGRLMTRMWHFDPDNYAGALELLDELYLGQLDDDLATVFRVVAALAAATNRGDIDFLADHFADAAVAVDHTSLSWPDLDAIGMVERARSVASQNLVFAAAELHRLTAAGIVYSSETWDPTSGFGTAGLSCVIFDAGKVVTWETFAADDLKAALARFDELIAEAGC
ncbi:MAG: hypothetical protein ACR2PK_17870, partial [Acidimicrobiales bacterium]